MIPPFRRRSTYPVSYFLHASGWGPGPRGACRRHRFRKGQAGYRVKGPIPGVKLVSFLAWMCPDLKGPRELLGTCP